MEVIFRNRIKNPFTWVENDLVRLKSLSYEAKGLYLTLKSFGDNIYPSIDYLCGLGNIGKNKLYRILDELLEKKLIMRKRTRGKKGLLGKTEYMLLSPTDNYEEAYKEFTGEDPKNPQTLENTKSYPRPQNPDVDNPDVDFETIKRIIDKEESLKEKESHTQTDEKDKSVCKIEKIKKTKTFHDIEPAIIENLLQKNGEKAVIAAEYIEKTFAGKIVRNPAGLLIATLKSGLYSELPQETRNLTSIKTDIKKLNGKYKGFSVFQGEKIKEILNIGGKVAFYTDNCLRDLVYTSAKSYEEFETFLNRQKKINSS